MVANEPSEVLASLPDEVQQIVLAFSIVHTRIQSLPPADRESLFQLMMAQHKTQDREEQVGIRKAMIEILTQGAITAKQLPLSDRPISQDSKMWAVHVGKTIRALRDKAGLTQGQLGEKAGLPQSHISRLENAEYTATNLTLNKIAKALGVTVGEIDPCAD